MTKLAANLSQDILRGLATENSEYLLKSIWSLNGRMIFIKQLNDYDETSGSLEIHQKLVKSF